MLCYTATGDRIGALMQYDECQRLLRDELGVEPSSETIALRDRIEQELTGGRPKEALLTNVPVPLTSFVGRQREMAEIKRLLNLRGLPDLEGLQTRLLTLTGAGGCGKTRLAIQVATDLAGRDTPPERLYQDGVWWVELAALSDPALVPHKVAQVFGLRESADAPPLTVLTNCLRAKEMLLVLDNCEHLIGACAQLAETLLSACPKLQILATSREALSLTGEVAWYVPSLESPDPHNMPPLASLAQYDAIRLLTERAQAVAPHWQLADHAEAAARICCRLDGMPLAIELAAARLKVLPAEQVAERLDDRFQLLTGGSRTALPRHRTLQATLDWSHNLLSEEEQVLFRRLTVFAGGWTLEAAEKVCSGEWVEGRDLPTMLDVLTALVDKSLVVVESSGKATRYRLLETIRQYAREKLLEANESETYSRRHLDWFIQLAEQADPKLHGREQMEWLERLELDKENLRAALAWSLESCADQDSAEPGLRLAGALASFWYFRGYGNEGPTWLERALKNRAITPARAKALVGLGGLLVQFGGSWAKPHALFDEGLALYRQQGDKWGIANAAGFCAIEESDPSRASALFEEARSIAQELKDEWLAAATDNRQGLYATRRGDLSLACSLYESALDHARHAGDRILIGDVLVRFGNVALAQRDYDRAAALYEQSMSIARNSGDKFRVMGRLNQLGELARQQDDYVRAAAFYAEALQLGREIKDVDMSSWEAVWLGNLGFVALHEHDYVRAGALFEESLSLLRQHEDTFGYTTCCVAGFAGIMEANAKPQQAAQLLGAVKASCQAHSSDLDPADQMEYDHILAAVRAQLDEATFNAAWEEGRKMTLEQAIEYALKA